jgi:hypothetical protein
MFVTNYICHTFPDFVYNVGNQAHSHTCLSFQKSLGNHKRLPKNFNVNLHSYQYQDLPLLISPLTMEYVLSHLVAISMIGFTAVPFYYFETSLVVALKKLTME